MDRDTQEWLRPWRADAAGEGPTVDRGTDVTTRIGADGGARPSTTRLPVDGTGGASGGTRVGPVRVGRPTSPPPSGRSPFERPTAAPDDPGAGSARPVPPSDGLGRRSTSERADAVPRHEGTSSTAAPPARAGDGPARPAGRWAAPSPGTPSPSAPSPSPASSGQPAPGRVRVGLVGLVAGLLGATIGTAATIAVTDGDPGGDAPAAATAPPSGEEEQDGTGSTTSPVVDPSSIGEGETVVSAVAEAVLPSVVRIDVFVTEDDPDLGEVDVPFGVGSGVVYSDDGYVLTNNHVVDGSDTVTVQLADGSQQQAEVVGTDRLTDLAVLRLDATDLTPVTLRSDDPLVVGETAVAIGSPFGLDASVTAGVVSAVNRDLEVPGTADEPAFVIAATIQTDAAINPGNSGGALVDSQGRLIGINTAILTNNGGSQGVGFAIPTRAVVVAADQLIERGFVSHPFLGIAGLDVTNELAARYAEEYDIDLDDGAVVDEVVEGSGAAEAGMLAGDVIVRLDGDDIMGMTDVIAAILRYDTGDTVPVVVLRDGERLTLEVTLGERPLEGS